MAWLRRCVRYNTARGALREQGRSKTGIAWLPRAKLGTHEVGSISDGSAGNHRGHSGRVHHIRPKRIRQKSRFLERIPAEICFKASLSTH